MHEPGPIPKLKLCVWVRHGNGNIGNVWVWVPDSFMLVDMFESVFEIVKGDKTYTKPSFVQPTL